MLVVTRKVGEGLRIGENIVVTVVQVSSGAIRVGIVAPRDAVIWRSELLGGTADASEVASKVARSSRANQANTDQQD